MKTIYQINPVTRVTLLQGPTDEKVLGYDYDANGRLTGITDPNNIVSSFSNFDALGLAQTHTLTGTDGTSTRTTGLRYDALAQLIKITQGAATPLIT